MTTYNNLVRTLATATALAFASGSQAEVDKTVLGGIFGYARGTPDTSLQDNFIVETASNPERVYASKKVERSGSVWELPLGDQVDPSRMTYTFKGKTQTLSDYLEKTRTTGLLIIRDGKVVLEKYQYDRVPSNRFLSFSMAKTITAILVGIAVQDGLIKNLDDTVGTYVPDLSGSAYASVTIRQLLTMTSGVRWNDNVEGGASDMLELNECHMRHRGCASSLALLSARKAQQSEPGTRFSYSGGDSMVLGHVLRAVTKRDVTTYTKERLWNRIGAEGDAAWMVDRQGVENVFGHFAAQMRDYGRLGMLLANQGARNSDQVLSPQYWQEMTTPQLPASRPRVATPYFGYGYQLWLDPKPGVFCMRGLKGQAVYVDVSKKLVVVRLAVARFGDHDDPSERDYMWHGIRAAFPDVRNTATISSLQSGLTQSGTGATYSLPNLPTTQAPTDDFGNEKRTLELLEELSRTRQ